MDDNGNNHDGSIALAKGGSNLSGDGGAEKDIMQCVQVAVHIRPLINHERLQGCKECITVIPGEPQVQIGTHSFTFDHVYGSTGSPSSAIFEECVAPLVDGLFQGYNATVLAYGQTGSGKTYTMGTAYTVGGNTEGVIPKVMEAIFKKVEELKHQGEILLKVSFIEGGPSLIGVENCSQAMSFRGRGGGGGRFAGRRTYQAPIKDENGNIKKPEPPTLFPDIKVLPVLPEISMKDEELVSKRRKLDHFWELSPYYIENPKEKTVGVIAEIERYSDRYKPNVRINRPPLSSVLKLAAAYFPSEILNQGSKRARAYKGTSQWTVQPDAADLQKFDRLENLEQKAQQRSEKVGDKEPDEKKEGENEDGEEEEIEDEEEDLGDDDYNQNFGFDDDEDYLDMDDGGDIEEATY